MQSCQMMKGLNIIVYFLLFSIITLYLLFLFDSFINSQSEEISFHNELCWNIYDLKTAIQETSWNRKRNQNYESPFAPTIGILIKSKSYKNNFFSNKNLIDPRKFSLNRPRQERREEELRGCDDLPVATKDLKVVESAIRHQRQEPIQKIGGRCCKVTHDQAIFSLVNTDSDFISSWMWLCELKLKWKSGYISKSHDNVT